MFNLNSVEPKITMFVSRRDYDMLIAHYPIWMVRNWITYSRDWNIAGVTITAKNEAHLVKLEWAIIHATAMSRVRQA